jgi:hypothetical protein
MAKIADERKSKECISCRRTLHIADNFYSSNSNMFPEGRVPICKECLKKLVIPDDISSVKRILRQIDKPFIKDVWDKAVTSPKETFGDYMRMILSLPQYKSMNYDDSSREDIVEAHIFAGDEEDEEVYDMPEEDFNVTPDMVFKWGNKYRKNDYRRLEDLYTRMTQTHDINAPQHKELLKLMCKLNLKMEKCLENDDINGFSKLHAEYQKLLASSGFRPIDRKSGDEATGLRSFSAIFEEVEKDGFIDMPPVTLKQDLVDKCIMYILNYQRKLLNIETLHKPPEDTPKVDDEGEGW